MYILGCKTGPLFRSENTTFSCYFTCFRCFVTVLLNHVLTEVLTCFRVCKTCQNPSFRCFNKTRVFGVLEVFAKGVINPSRKQGVMDLLSREETPKTPKTRVLSVLSENTENTGFSMFEQKTPKSR